MNDRPTIYVDPKQILEREFVKLFGGPPARRPIRPPPNLAPRPAPDLRGAVGG